MRKQPVIQNSNSNIDKFIHSLLAILLPAILNIIACISILGLF